MTEEKESNTERRARENRERQRLENLREPTVWRKTLAQPLNLPPKDWNAKAETRDFWKKPAAERPSWFGPDSGPAQRRGPKR